MLGRTYVRSGMRKTCPIDELTTEGPGIWEITTCDVCDLSGFAGSSQLVGARNGRQCAAPQ